MWSTLVPSLAGSLFVVQLANVTYTENIRLAGALAVNEATLGSAATFIAAAGVRCLISNFSTLACNANKTVPKEYGSWR